MIKSMHIYTSNQKEEENTLTSGNLIVAGRVAVTVTVVLFLAVGLQGRVARVLEKATVPVSDDGLAWIRRTRCSAKRGSSCSSRC